MMLGYTKGHAGPAIWTVSGRGLCLLGRVVRPHARGRRRRRAYGVRALLCAGPFRTARSKSAPPARAGNFSAASPARPVAISLQKVTAGEVCQALTGQDAVHRHGNVVHCSRDIRDGRYLLGQWTITPYNIVNWQECGPVRYSAQLEVRQRLSAAHYTGVTKFNWDTSRLVPGCSFPAAERGTIPTELFVDGDRITVKYRATGNNNYADDHLVLRGDVMAGNDVAGQRVVYTKTSDTAAQTSLSFHDLLRAELVAVPVTLPLSGQNRPGARMRFSRYC